MVKKLYEIFTDKKLNYAIKWDGIGQYRSNENVEYVDYNVFVASLKVDETDVESELLDLIRPYATTCNELPP